MLYKKILFFLFLLQIIFFVSCFDGFKDKKEDYNYPEYNTDVIWEMQTHFTSEYPNFFQDKNYLYCSEKTENNKKNGFLSKINLSDGSYVWKSEEFPFSDLGSAPLVVGEYVFVRIKGGDVDDCMYVFSKDSGKILAVIQLWITDDDRDNLQSTIYMVSYNNTIYWAGYGLFKFDISKIDFSISSKEIQLIVPERIWYDNNNYLNISMHPVFYDNVMYFQTLDLYGYNEGKTTRSKVVAYDIERETELWHYDCKKLYGYGFENMIILNDRLYTIEQGIGCFDLKTGKCYYEHFQTTEDLMHEDTISGGLDSPGIAYNNGKFFYTNTANWSSSPITGIPQKNLHNIICLDAKTLKMVWGQMPKGSGSQSVCPTVMNGKVFVPLWLQGLCVLDETSGRVLGIDTSIISLGYAKSFSYSGVAYFMDYSNARFLDKPNNTRLIAIRP